jgi:hypothetical protein
MIWAVTWAPQAGPNQPGPRLKPILNPGVRLAPPGKVAEAIVEVWADTTQEPLRQFQARLAPELVQAYNKGYACDTSAQILCEFMGMIGDIKPLSCPAVYYNCLQPSRYDPAILARTAKGGAWLNADLRASGH